MQAVSPKDDFSSLVKAIAQPMQRGQPQRPPPMPQVTLLQGRAQEVTAASGDNLAAEVAALDKYADAADKVAQAAMGYTPATQAANTQVDKDAKALLNTATAEEKQVELKEQQEHDGEVQGIESGMTHQMDELAAASLTDLNQTTTLDDKQPDDMNDFLNGLSPDNSSTLKDLLGTSPSGSLDITSAQEDQAPDESVTDRMVVNAAQNVSHTAADIHKLLNPPNTSAPTAAPTTAPPTAAPSLPLPLHMPALPAPEPNITATYHPIVNVMPESTAMPPIPGALDCASALARGEAQCKLHFWTAVDRCTSETLSPAEAWVAPECQEAQETANQACIASLSSCPPSKAAEEAKRLRDEILKSPTPTAPENVVGAPTPDAPPVVGLGTHLPPALGLGTAHQAQPNLLGTGEGQQATPGDAVLGDLLSNGGLPTVAETAATVQGSEEEAVVPEAAAAVQVIPAEYDSEQVQELPSQPEMWPDLDLAQLPSDEDEEPVGELEGTIYGEDMDSIVRDMKVDVERHERTNHGAQLDSFLDDWGKKEPSRTNPRTSDELFDAFQVPA